MPKSPTPVDRTALPPTFDHLSKKPALVRRVPIVMSEEAYQAFQEAESRHSRLDITGATEAELVAAAAELDEARQALQASTIVMEMRSIGRKAYDALVEEHQATPDQIAEYRKQYKNDEAEPPYNVNTFPSALVAASCRGADGVPTMTVEQVSTLFEDWTSAEVMAVFGAALEVNTQRRVVELGKGRG